MTAMAGATGNRRRRALPIALALLLPLATPAPAAVPATRSRRGWMADPRLAVLIALGAVASRRTDRIASCSGHGSGRSG